MNACSDVIYDGVPYSHTHKSPCPESANSWINPLTGDELWLCDQHRGFHARRAEEDIKEAARIEAFIETARFEVRRQCQCSASDRSNGWGCCCAIPLRALTSENGTYRLVKVREG